jgi:hypothetical protein
MTHTEQVGAPAAYAELKQSDLVIGTVAATRPAVDYLMEHGHSREAAEYAATWAYLESQRVPTPGVKCARCGKPGMWIMGAGMVLCVRHQDSY